MKNSIIALMSFLAIALCSSNSLAGRSEVRGAVIGAGSGAIIGGAIGGTAESVVIGSAIGGAIGATAGHYHRRGFPLPPPPPAILPPPPPPRFPHPHVKKRHRVHRVTHPGPNCRIHHRTVWRHGHPVTITNEVCDYYPPHHHGHHHGHHHRHDRHHHFN